MTMHVTRRRPIRLPGYDYTGKGGYFLTLCTWGRACLFGEVVEGEMRANALGKVVREEWLRTAEVRPGVCVYPYEFVVMPNHIHGIVWIMAPVGATRRVARGIDENVRVTAASDALSQGGPTNAATHHEASVAGATRRAAPTGRANQGAPARGPHPGSIGAIVGQFKFQTTKRINAHRGTPGAGVWQRNYYEHVIRDGESLDHIRQYIAENPVRWDLDGENPHAIRSESEYPWARL